MNRRPISYYCDAAVDSFGRICGAAVVVREASGRIVDTVARRLPGMTNNEAEYEALIMGLDLALRRGDLQAVFLLDSQIVVGQIAGCFAVRDRKLQPRHERASRLLAHLPEATLVFIPREQNRLADALAKDTLDAARQGGGDEHR